MSRYQYFTTEELACKCGCGGGEDDMDPEFMAKICAMRLEAGFAFPVSSGYRCPEHNATVSSTGRTGPHTTGKALDIKVSRKKAMTLIKLGLEYNITGFGVSQKGSVRFIHVDTIDREEDLTPTVWSY